MSKHGHRIELIPPTKTEDINKVIGRSRGYLAYAVGKNPLTDYVAEHKIPYIDSRSEMFKKSISLAVIDGIFIELGVYVGGTIREIASIAPNRQIYGLDTFEGFPEDYTEGVKKGDCKTDMPEVPDNVILIKGLIQDTLGPLLKKEKQPIAFLHVDCDLYNPTHSAFEDCAKYKRIVPGTVIQFDELFEMINYEGDGKSWWFTDEIDAWHEFRDKYKVKYRWIGSTGEHASVIIDEITYPKKKNEK
jgi:hypothetical protein